LAALGIAAHPPARGPPRRTGDEDLDMDQREAYLDSDEQPE
jgi:hypothetical protein